MGNSRARAVYEANLPDDYRRPQNDQAMEAFIRQKYEKKKYIAAEWVPTKPPDFPEGWNEAGPGQEKKPEFKKLQLPPKSTPASSPVSKSSSSPRPEVPSELSLLFDRQQSLNLLGETKPSPAPVVTSSSLECDLLGLSLSSAPAPAPAPAFTSSASSDLFGINSEFNGFVSASPLPSTAPATGTETFLTVTSVTVITSLTLSLILSSD